MARSLRESVGWPFSRQKKQSIEPDAVGDDARDRVAEC